MVCVDMGGISFARMDCGTEETVPSKDSVFCMPYFSGSVDGYTDGVGTDGSNPDGILGVDADGAGGRKRILHPASYQKGGNL